MRLAALTVALPQPLALLGVVLHVDGLLVEVRLDLAQHVLVHVAPAAVLHDDTVLLALQAVPRNHVVKLEALLALLAQAQRLLRGSAPAESFSRLILRRSVAFVHQDDLVIFKN